MPKVESYEVEVIPGDIYMMRLCQIEVKQSNLKRDDGTQGKMWIWNWYGKKEKQLAKPDAKIYQPQTVTGNTVSEKDSILKFILMNSYPDMSLEEMKKFNTDEMVDRMFRIKFGVVTDDGGKQKNKILGIEMMPEDYADPFSDDSDEDDD